MKLPERFPPDPLGGPRDPLRIALMVWFVISGLALAVGLDVSRTLTGELGGMVERVYGAILAVSAGAVLVGMFWPWDLRDGLTAKLAGWSGLAVTSIIFSLATLGSWSWSGAFVAVTALLFAGYSGRIAFTVVKRMRDAAALEASSHERS